MDNKRKYSQSFQKCSSCNQYNTFSEHDNWTKQWICGYWLYRIFSEGDKFYEMSSNYTFSIKKIIVHTINKGYFGLETPLYYYIPNDNDEEANNYLGMLVREGLSNG